MLSSSSALVAQGLRSACRRFAGRGRALCSYSMSSPRAQEASGSHLLRIGGYSVVDKRFPTGEPVVSAPFLVGGREWELGFYPNGILSPGSVGAVLMPRLALGKSNARPLWGDDPVAEYKVSILDRAGNQVYGRSVGLRGFSYSMCWGSVQRSLELLQLEGRSPEGGCVLGPAIVDLVAKEELRRALPHLLDNDCLSVRCDVTALELVDMETAVGGLSAAIGKQDYFGRFVRRLYVLAGNLVGTHRTHVIDEAHTRTFCDCFSSVIMHVIERVDAKHA